MMDTSTTQDMQVPQAAQAAHIEVIAPCRLGKEKKAVYDLLLGNQRNGVQDMTRTEIRYSYEMLYGKRIDDGRVSSIISKLLKANMVGEGNVRICSRTQRNKGTVCISAEQARMFA